ncbi:MAG: type II toxin-antitoxin system HicB family antitoxin [Spirochaetales bacterium]|nr:type II toxin-antitoxin system HicB family antitoxin [Spirochaetales bacterium]MBO6048640.1 type II toxin-antitoxin system HicB family antitoxin [Spirochaetales bacterium]MBP5756414.1 type II toxin-antitoxin system HicB family antitoxin [Spirochaetales bacterium]
MKYVFTAVIKEDSGTYYVSFPDLKGCITTGKSLSDAIDQATDALSGWLCVAEDEKLDIPIPSNQDSIKRESGEYLAVIKADTISYRAATDKRAVRKNVSLPAWLARLSDQRRLNCSQILQDALIAKLS